MGTDLTRIIQRYKEDPESVYNTWFVENDTRLKAFRSIRRGVQTVIGDIKSGSFGNEFKGSSLESVLICITEQKQVFEGAAHPFYWKPKLRIPDIYENEANKAAFGRFLECCLAASKEETLVQEIVRLDARSIKGLGPAVASILYFLHPTLVPPFNTAIVNGFNALFGGKIKLGKWSDYLAMREAILEANVGHKRLLSTDLGAFAGLLFEIGIGRLPIGAENIDFAEQKAKLDKLLTKRHAEILSEHQEENLHTEMQYHLLRIGKALGYDVAAAANDRSRQHAGVGFSQICIPALPPLGLERDTFATVALIDALWLEQGMPKVVSAFEVEKSTSIYSGILRLTDLALSFPGQLQNLFLVVPDHREKEALLQLQRPAIRNLNTRIEYILFSDLRTHCDSICRFGTDYKVMSKIARRP